jgi:hypothetical protein
VGRTPLAAGDGRQVTPHGQNRARWATGIFGKPPRPTLARRTGQAFGVRTAAESHERVLVFGAGQLSNVEARVHLDKISVRPENLVLPAGFGDIDSCAKGVDGTPGPCSAMFY